MMSLSERKEERLYRQVMDNEIVSARTYNLYLGGVIAYGLIMNIIMCNRFAKFVLSMNPIVFIIGYALCYFAGVFISGKSKSPLISFLGYNLVAIPVGMVASVCVTQYGGLSSAVVQQAFAYTAGITCTMICLSILYPKFFSNLGGLLFGGLIGAVLVGIVLLFLRSNPMWYSVACAILFSFYIGYDFWKAQQYPKTVDNAVDSALDIYIDIINLFIRILSILGRGSSSSKKRSF